MGIQSFKELYLSHFNALTGFAESYVKDGEVAMDIAQETFFKLYQRLDKSYSQQHAVAFIYITAKNQCMDFLRHARSRTEDVDNLKEKLFSDEFFLDEITRQEMVQCIQQAVEQLTGRSYQIARLALLGKSNQEIADELNISINSVKTHKKEMYAKLRNLLGNEFVMVFLVKKILQIEG